MAGQDFDFDAFRGQKFAEYKKKDIKPAIVRKAKGGIVFTDYKLAGKKIPCVFIPMKKTWSHFKYILVSLELFFTSFCHCPPPTLPVHSYINTNMV